MSAGKASTFLSVLFAVSCCFCLGLVLLVRERNEILASDVDNLIGGLAKVYSGPIGLIAGGLLAGSKSGQKRLPALHLLPILVVSIAWNVVILWEFVSFVLGTTLHAAEVAQFCSMVAERLSFLIVAILAYLYGKIQRAP
jgi:hypothetical protein